MSEGTPTELVITDDPTREYINLGNVRDMPRSILIQRDGHSPNGLWTMTVNPGNHPTVVTVLDSLCWEEMLGEIAARTIPNEVFLRKNRFSGGVTF